VLVPLATAFEQADDDGADVVDTDASLMRAILRSGTTFSPALQAIPAQADAIQRELNRSVWNANIRQGGARDGTRNAAGNPAFSKVLLGEIVRTGTRMKDVFTRSIKDLQTMTIRSQLDDCQFLAALAIDILDRNLYERANDCRWWALDPLLRGLLDDRDALDRATQLAARLAAINALYAVYDSLVLFDADGVVVAVSKPALAALAGTRLDAAWCAKALGAPHESYVVSDFIATDLYGGRATYIYSAPMRSDSGKVIGGIATVFDSAPQLEAVLAAGMPQSAGAFALFIDADDNVVASTDAACPAGGKAGVPAVLRAAALEGTGTAQLIALHGQVLAVGARGSSGYREYSGTEGRAGQRLLALVCVPLCADDGYVDEADDDALAVSPASSVTAAATGETVDIASFYVGHYLLGVPASAVVEAIPFGGIVRLPNASDKLCGATIYQGSTMLLYDLHKALGVSARGKRENMLTVVLRGAEGRPFGVLVEKLGDIPAVALSDIAPMSNVFVGVAPILASVVMTHAGDSGPMLTLLKVEEIVRLLNQD
jgi:chemotaxis signal transduction protein